MNEVKTNLRQGTNKVTVTGIIAEKELAVEYDEGIERIKGTVSVKVDDLNTIRFSVNCRAKTNSGSDNKVYAGLQTVMREYKSIAEVGIESADKVRATGELNPYHSTTSGQDMMFYKGNFFNRAKDPTNFENSTEFDVELYIQAIVPEMDREGNETGRVLVKGWLPTYNGIEPVMLVADTDLADGVQNTFSAGQTAEFFGNIISSRVEKRTMIPVALGKPKEKIETSYKNELIITGASEPYEEGVTMIAPYETETIKLAIQERENRIQNANREDNKVPFGQPKPTGSASASGRTLNF